MTVSPTVVRQTERWLIRRGMPLLIADYSFASHILPRMVPFLALVPVTGLLWPLRDEPAALVAAGPGAGVGAVRGGHGARGRRTVARGDRTRRAGPAGAPAGQGLPGHPAFGRAGRRPRFRRGAAAIVVGLWRFGFFVVLGLIVVDPATAEQWIGEPPRTVAGNRRRFFTPILGEDERTLAVRAVYLAAHDRQS